jgi:hypothetical protein
VTDYLKLTTYFAERLRSENRFLADALLDSYAREAVATSIVLRGIASFGPHHEFRSDEDDARVHHARAGTPSRPLHTHGADAGNREAHHLRRTPGPGVGNAGLSRCM